MSLRTRIEAVERELRRLSKQLTEGISNPHATTSMKLVLVAGADANEQAADLIAAALKEEEGGDGN